MEADGKRTRWSVTQCLAGRGFASLADRRELALAAEARHGVGGELDGVATRGVAALGGLALYRN
ncbi:hypothetical protein OBG91_15805 [Lactococcus lactis]|nr:hypothetical protein [Lactococcus lactis]